jgi:hypothetical protein
VVGFWPKDEFDADTGSCGGVSHRLAGVTTVLRQRSGGHGRPPRRWHGTMNRVVRAQAVSDRSES